MVINLGVQAKTLYPSYISYITLIYLRYPHTFNQKNKQKLKNSGRGEGHLQHFDFLEI